MAWKTNTNTNTRRAQFRSHLFIRMRKWIRIRIRFKGDVCISRAAPSHFSHRLTWVSGLLGWGGGGEEDRGKLRRRISSEKSDTQVTHMHFFFSFLFFSFFLGEFRLEYSYVPVCQSYVLVCTRMYSYVTRMYSYVTVCHSYVPVWCISHYLRNPTT